jgi:hypothetical protein
VESVTGKSPDCQPSLPVNYSFKLRALAASSFHLVVRNEIQNYFRWFVETGVRGTSYIRAKQDAGYDICHGIWFHTMVGGWPGNRFPASIVNKRLPSTRL